MKVGNKESNFSVTVCFTAEVQSGSKETLFVSEGKQLIDT